MKVENIKKSFKIELQLNPLTIGFFNQLKSKNPDVNEIIGFLNNYSVVNELSRDYLFKAIFEQEVLFFINKKINNKKIMKDLLNSLGSDVLLLILNNLEFSVLKKMLLLTSNPYTASNIHLILIRRYKTLILKNMSIEVLLSINHNPALLKEMGSLLDSMCGINLNHHQKTNLINFFIKNRMHYYEKVEDYILKFLSSDCLENGDLLMKSQKMMLKYISSKKIDKDLFYYFNHQYSVKDGWQKVFDYAYQKQMKGFNDFRLSHFFMYFNLSKKMIHKMHEDNNFKPSEAMISTKSYNNFFESLLWLKKHKIWLIKSLIADLEKIKSETILLQNYKPQVVFLNNKDNLTIEMKISIAEGVFLKPLNKQLKNIPIL